MRNGDQTPAIRCFLSLLLNRRCTNSSHPLLLEPFGRLRAPLLRLLPGRALERCTARAEERATPASVDWSGCLGLRSVMLGPKQIHKVLEDSSFVWRSLYAAHLRR